MNENAVTGTLAANETWLEAWPLDVAARAVRFINFLHESAAAADVELEPAEGGRYRFRVSVPPSTVMEALLASSDFFPESVHSSVSGPLEVRLPASSDSGPPAAARRSPSRQSAEPQAPSSPGSDEQPGGSSLVHAFEHLDQALGEAPAS